VIRAALLGLVTGLVVACGAAPSPIQQADEAAYGGNQLVCVASSSDKAHADQCRDMVKAYWCGDGGALAAASACRDVTLSDGGRP